MRNFLFFILFFFIIAITPLVGLANQEPIPVVVDGDEVTYSQREDKLVAKGNVVMKYKDIEIRCDEAVYDVGKNYAYIKGNVKVNSPRGILKGENAVYDFNLNKVEIKKIRMESFPFYGGGKSGEGIINKKYILGKGYITTCDYSQPHYKLVAKRFIIYPQKKVVARNVFLVVGKIPIFYLPYYSQSLKEKSFPVEVSPGKSGEWGFYFLTRWRYHLNENSKGKLILDWYERRGLGRGLTHRIETSRFGKGLFNYYFIDDQLYSLDKRDELFDEYPERKEIPSKYLNPHRYKGQFSYSWHPTSNLSIKSEFHKFSDENFMKDFFYREYEIEPHPLTYTLVDYAFPNSSLSLLIQKRANHFFTETEYLPKLEYDIYKQKIVKDLPLYLESKTSFANLNKKFANSAQDYDTLRLHTHNILSYESGYRWLNYSPYIGLYTTYYTKDISGERDLFRNAFQAGISLSTKLYKIFSGGFTFLGEKIDKIRHIVTPIFTYSYLHPPSVANSSIFQFDSIDSIERKESVVFTLENKFQAKNSQGKWDFLYFSPSVEYKINQEGKGSFFDSIKADLEFYPKKGVSFVADTKYDVGIRRFTEFNADLNIKDTKNDRYSLSLGHRYVRTTSSQGTLNLIYQLTSKVQFKNYLRYEYNTGDLKEQEHSLRFDLHCWWLDVGVNVDRQREGVKDYVFWCMFTLKAFPEKVHFGFEKTYHGARQSY